MSKKIHFNGETFDSEFKRNSYVFHNKEKILSSFPGFFSLAVVSFFISLILLFFGLDIFSGFILSFILISFGYKSHVSNVKKEIDEYSDEYLVVLNNIEYKIRNTVLKDFFDRYYFSQDVQEKIPELTNFINEKFNKEFTDIDTFYLLRIYFKNELFKEFDTYIKDLKSPSVDDVVTVYVNKVLGIDLVEAIDINDPSISVFVDDTVEKNVVVEFNKENNNFATFILFLDFLKEYLIKKNISFDEKELKTLLFKKIKLLRAEHFEKRLSFSENFNLEKINTMNGFEFESFIGDLFKKAGYVVKVTKKTGDQGADILVKKNGICTAVQTKKYSGSVGNKAVQEIVAAKKFYDCDKALVITTGYFTKSAVDLAKKNDVRLIDKKNLETFIDILQ